MNPKIRKGIVIGGIAIAAILLVYFVYSTVESKKEMEKANEMLQLENQQLQLAGEYENLNAQYQNLESQTKFINNDSILHKYSEAKSKVEKLLAELKTQKITSNKRIKELQDEIKSLKGLMKHYIAIIDSLNKENAGLRAENVQIKSENRKLASEVNIAQEKNAHLEERMELAEKLNITNLNLVGLKKNGKVEKKIKKAKQLAVTFTISPNNSTPVGEKELFVRITSPEGTLLGGSGTFTFEGAEVPYTDSKKIEYTGQEVPDVTIYWNVDTPLSQGDYRVEVFADNYRLSSRLFSMK
ncbi:MAG: hypothetical protein IJ328_06620 [Muribaculaceae bacterium]|nr:hypothetical protein [Muribaculaceae bacterium]